jgi:hypothetical protein
MKLTFESQGRTWTLNKHPVIQKQLRDGSITETEAATKPWYLRRRADFGGTSKLSADDSQAIAEAKALLKASVAQPTEWKEFLAEKAARQAVTLRDLATEWIALDMPDNAGRPRDPHARTELKPLLEQALEYWGNKSAQTITQGNMLAYATQCRQQCKANARSTSGERKADKGLSVLSCLCKWAVATEKIKSNPFVNRPRIQAAKAIKHCHEFTCDSDEQWHQILAWFFTHPADELHLRVSGAWLAFCGLVGLRREEPSYLFRFARLKEAPTNPAKLPPGTIFPTREGKMHMRVTRVKHGQNPYVLLHPAALDFLDTWEKWLDSTFVQSTPARPLFPNPRDPSRPLATEHFREINRRLERAAEFAKLPKLTTHGFGRAFYVRVRRSQGADDSVIASELGQTTNGKLIRDTYGNADDLRGGALFDWLPAKDEPAWKSLTTSTAENKIIRL